MESARIVLRKDLIDPKTDSSSTVGSVLRLSRSCSTFFQLASMTSKFRPGSSNGQHQNRWWVISLQDNSKDFSTNFKYVRLRNMNWYSIIWDFVIIKFNGNGTSTSKLKLNTEYWSIFVLVRTLALTWFSLASKVELSKFFNELKSEDANTLSELVVFALKIITSSSRRVYFDKE
ncbi:hypothetical protein OGAPHI_001506 [Ogataea philodendri]|uniref:Uncharacterized protein n=1 Tax=Ogataea philodendri TaxID=1378263 RepID=A0A9P8PD34_9ASCO|nr:uncharacterized protein OGAPHI_001506 [Ogataea philodendri]KAH3669385.1 hypothetical protein OGAPHI_001506 [Ogataea philodendri]